MIEIEELWTSGSLSFLEDLNERVELKIDESNVTNLSIAHFSIKNVGQKEILKTDFHQNLQIKVNEPWEIIGISADYTKPKHVELEWISIDNNISELKPMLINPNDYYQASVYITNTEFDSQADEEARPKFQWSARITNLHEIRIKGQDDRIVKYWVGFHFNNMDGLLFIFISLALSCLTAYLLCLSLNMFILDPKGIMLVVVSGIFSITSATIITGNLVGQYMGRYNALPIWLICGVHFIALLYAVITIVKRSNQSES